jgi:site-specific DNA-cytosine methylase
MKVLSLFDGMSCGRIALERAGIKVSNYFASEIEKASITVSEFNYPDIIQIGDVTKVTFKDGVLCTENGDFNVGNIDIVLGGSPCQSISTLGDGSGLEGKSKLFWHYKRILDEVNPKYFLLENVVGSKKAIEEITTVMGVQPHKINSNSFSAQNRSRLYWTNIPVKEIESNQVKLADILDITPSKHSELTPGRLRWLLSNKGQETVKKKYAAIDPERANCLTARSDASWNCNYVTRQGKLTKLTPEEYEKLQTVPVGYTGNVSASARYKMLGNGWTVDVIVHILKGIQ